MFLRFSYLVMGFGTKENRNLEHEKSKFKNQQTLEFAPTKPRSASANPCMHSSIQISRDDAAPADISFRSRGQVRAREHPCSRPRIGLRPTSAIFLGFPTFLPFFTLLNLIFFH